MEIVVDGKKDVATDGFLVDPALRKQSRIAAKGYALLFLYYAAITLLTLGQFPWASLDQVLVELSAQSEAIVTLGGFLIGNAVLTVCAWHVFSMYRWGIRIVMSVAVLTAAGFCAIVVLSVLAWLSPDSGSVGLWTISASVLQFLAYGSCAWLLLRAIWAFNAQRAQAMQQSKGAMPTTTL